MADPARPDSQRVGRALARDHRSQRHPSQDPGHLPQPDAPTCDSEHRRTAPEAVVVWLDAHADLNVPDGAGGSTDYLGGMAVSGPLGWWDSGFGAGLSPQQLLLVGTRSIDAPEATAIEAHRIPVLPPQVADGAAVTAAVGGRPVFFHLDCDVLEPGVFRTDYQEPSGLSLAQLAEITHALAASSDVVGVEIAEWEGAGRHTAADLVSCVTSVLDSGATAR